MSRADELAAIESGMLSLNSLNGLVISAAKALTTEETGFILVDASASGFTVTLPPATASMDILVRRVDNGGNRLVVKAAGADLIKFHTHLSPTGYPFFVLMGAGDFWHLRCDGGGSWIPLNRLDPTPLGRAVFETTVLFSPGGYGALNNSVFTRSQWPWLWDHAQQSGMLTTEVGRIGMEGGWTSGNGATSFRGPDGRGEFLRVWDESRGVDNVNFSGNITSGSPTISAVRFQGVVVSNGMVLTGVGIPANATVTGFDTVAGTITMSANATATTAALTIAAIGRVAGSRQNGSIVAGDMDGTGGFAPASTPAPEQPRTNRGDIGWDTPVLADYPAGISYTAGSTQVLNILMSNSPSYFGVSRPRNIAYPGRIKLI